MDEEKKGSGTGAVGVGMAAGGFLGAKIGIAGFFGAISGAVPLAVLGGYVGHKLYKAVTREPRDDPRSDRAGPSAAESFAAGMAEGFREGQEAARNAERAAAFREQRLAIARERAALPVPELPSRLKKPKPPDQR